MAKAWHKRVVETPTPQMPVWKASRYRLLQADPNAEWRRIDPFVYYRPLTKKRDPEAGPHVNFLRLRKMFLDKDAPYHAHYLTAMDVFASKYGLLGLFHYQYSAPILPELKLYIAPEAVIQNGHLELIDPAVTGLELIAKAINEIWELAGERFTQEHYSIIAMPDEVRFAARDPYRPPDDPSGRSLSPGNMKSWEEVRKGYDALFVYDPARRSKSSVLVRRESIFSWQRFLRDFPAPPYDDEQLPYLTGILNEWLADASPKATLREDGSLKRDWRCNTLLQAMYLMLYLDLTGGAEYGECASRDCPNSYRAGTQPSIYCSDKCANRASTRLGRGQEP